MNQVFPRGVVDRFAPWAALGVLLLAAALLGGLFALNALERDPVRSTRLIAVDPADRVLDRDTRTDFTVTREVCARKAEQVKVLREWTEFGPDGQAQTTTAWSVSYFGLTDGCQTVRARQPVSMTLPPGNYTFQVTLIASCRPLSTCPEYRLQPVPLSLVNGPLWPKAAVAPPPALPPPETEGPQREVGLPRSVR